MPEPVPASRALPEWLKAMPESRLSETLGGTEIRTIKHCPPVIDALRQGIIVRNAVDIHLKDGAVHWDWDPPAMPDSLISRGPVGVHVPEQVSGSPFEADHLILKFTNYWTFETDPDWSLMILHPVGFGDLPFHTLSGVVDTDRFAAGYIHFPARVSPEFEGSIVKGTPIAQLVPVRKDLELRIEEMTSDQISANRQVQEDLAATPGTYRKQFRR